MRLFIADDSEILRERLVESISEIENVVIVGQEGDKIRAIEAVEKLRPDLVIMDIKMPGGNGITALETLKKKENPPIVIMFTNYPYLQYRKKCMDAGADVALSTRSTLTHGWIFSCSNKPGNMLSILQCCCFLARLSLARPQNPSPLWRKAFISPRNPPNPGSTGTGSATRSPRRASPATSRPWPGSASPRPLSVTWM